MNRPDRYRDSVIPHVMVDGAAGAIDFYARAFGATELFRIAAPDGTILHAELEIGSSVVMVGDADEPFAAPAGVGASTVGLHVYVDDIQTMGDRAYEAGAEILQPLQDMFYGDRSIMLRDPFGHVWVLLQHVEDLDVDTIRARGEALLRGTDPAAAPAST